MDFDTTFIRIDLDLFYLQRNRTSSNDWSSIKSGTQVLSLKGPYDDNGHCLPLIAPSASATIVVLWKLANFQLFMDFLGTFFRLCFPKNTWFSNQNLPQIDVFIITSCAKTARIIQEICANHHIDKMISLYLTTKKCLLSLEQSSFLHIFIKVRIVRWK